MDRVFLDTNILIDIFEHRRNVNLETLSHFYLAYSPLSIHIYLYLYRKKVPLLEIHLFMQKLEADAVNFSGEILSKALEGPTSDFEDNVQLHSAAEAECDYFLTNDEKLLNMKFFGKTKIADSL